MKEDTPLKSMVNDYLKKRTDSNPAKHESDIQRLGDSFQRLSRDMGRRNWIREDLYER